MTEAVDHTNQIAKERFYQSLIKNPLARVSTDFVVTILFIVILFVVAIRPTIITIRKIQTSLDALHLYNTNLTTKIDNLKSMTILYQNNKQKFDLLDIAIPEQPQFPLIEKQIRYLITQNKFKILSLTFTEITLIRTPISNGNADDDSTKNTQTISFSLAANGDYDSVKNFISQLQTLSRLVSIQSFTISQSLLEKDKINFSLTGLVYFNL